MNELALIASDIKQEHTLAVNSARTAIEHAHKAGELLTEAKKQVKHGQWGQWMKDNLPFSERTAQAYMRVSKTQLSADLSIDETLALMAKPKKELPVFNLGDYVAFSHKPTNQGFIYYCIAEHPDHKGYYLLSKMEFFKGENSGGVQTWSKRGIHCSFMPHILDEWGIKAMDEFLMIPKKNIQDIYDFLYIPKPDPNKNYWEQ